MDKYNELSKKGELWRLRYTPQEFIKEVERIKKHERYSREQGYFTEAAIQTQVKSMLAVILMNKITYEKRRNNWKEAEKQPHNKF